jgi:hypothetical protein
MMKVNMNIRPTMREVKVVLNSLELNPDIYCHYNDTRVNGGRIKFYSRNPIPPQAVQTLEDRLSDMFPRWNINVTSYGRNTYTVHFKNIKQELIRTANRNKQLVSK